MIILHLAASTCDAESSDSLKFQSIACYHDNGTYIVIGAVLDYSCTTTSSTTDGCSAAIIIVSKWFVALFHVTSSQSMCVGGAIVAKHNGDCHLLLEVV